jgi:hypothetical protein
MSSGPEQPPGFGEEWPRRPLPPPGATAARDRVAVPAVLLIVVGALNLLLALLPLGMGVVAAVISDEKAEEFRLEALATYERQGIEVPALRDHSGAELRRAVALEYVPWGVISLVAGSLAIFAGARMYGLRSRGLAIAGSIVTLIPCVSCCCIGGQVAGIWALVVLLDSQVAAAFR